MSKTTPFVNNPIIVIPANGLLPVAVTGEYIYIKSAASTFYMRMLGAYGASEEIPMEQGDKLGPFPYNSLQFRNPTASNLVVAFKAGNVPVDYFPPFQLLTMTTKAARTYMIASSNGEKILTAGETNAYTGLNGADIRKQIVVTNLDAVAWLQICVSGVLCAPIPPLTPWTLEHSGPIEVHNATAGTLKHTVCETFYVS